MLAMVLARIRQLAAHETGHTLGLAHNFAASSISQSDSVMDYPHPYVTLDPSGHPDLSHAYAVNIGAWDKVSIDYGYREFPSPTDTPTALAAILATADKAGQIFITDEDARPFGSAHPHAHLWDNGPDPRRRARPRPHRPRRRPQALRRKRHPPRHPHVAASRHARPPLSISPLSN